MAKVAESALEAIRQRVDIVELVREYVPDLKPAGRNHKARCPFHQEKTPSFMVNLERQIFHCFGCQEGGDVFTFLMKIEGLGFSEAVERLAARAGVNIAPSAERLGPQEAERLKLRQVLAFAQEFYARVLAESREADAARRYLDGRGLAAATRQRFGVGFSLPDGSSFLDAAVRKGWAPELLAKAGLVSVSENKGRYRDFFRGRVLFPIRNTKGETVGFGGRVLGDGLPKYINSPDSPLFSKGRVLYGLFEGLAETRKSRRVVLLEGYMDVLAMHQFGLANACAPLGTALTPDHVVLLKRYADEAVLVFDPDDAGSAASLRGAEILLERGFSVRIATVPQGLDPDELLLKSGVQAMQACFASAQDLADFKITAALAAHRGALTAESKDRIARDVLTVIAKADSDILKAEWVRRLSERLKMDESALRSQLARGTGPERTARPRLHTGRGESLAAPADEVPPREAAMLRALLQAPELAKDSARVAEEDFEHPAARRLYRMALEGAPMDSLTPEDAALARRLLVSDRREEDPAGSLDRLVEEGRLLRRYRAVHEKISEMQRLGGPRDAELAAEYQGLLKRLSEKRLLDRLKDIGKE